MRFKFHGGFFFLAIRWFCFKAFTFIRNRQAGRERLNPGKRKILIYPACTANRKLADVFRKLSFAFPGNDPFSFYLRAPEKELPDARAMFQKLSAHKSHELAALQIQVLDRNESWDFDQYDLILCHRSASLPRIARYFYKTEIIDPFFYSHTESIALQRGLYHLLNEAQKNAFKESSERNFEKLAARLAGREQACCFLTGPSIGHFRTFRIADNSIRIICNSLVKNDEFLANIGGTDIITFADPVFHFGASDYAIRFREKMAEVAVKWDAFILVPEFGVPLLATWFPGFKEQIIGIETIPGGFRLPAPGQLQVRATNNIFTMLMLPLAAAFADKVLVAGADGRAKNEKYFWKFSPDAQFTEEMESAFKAHVSFFRDRRYRGYYKEHCAVVEEFLIFAESQGKSVVSVTPSDIPALNKRYKDPAL